MIDLILLAILAVVTWCVASEGAWGAVLMLFIVVFSGLLAMNFFEPLANLLQNNVTSSGAWTQRWDIIALVGLFAGFVFALRAGTEYLAPSFIPVQPLLYDVTRWACAALTGYVTMAFLLTALHTASLPREFIGFKPERNNFFNMAAPDRQWLGFMHRASETTFRAGTNGRIFDGPRIEVGDHENRIWPSFPIRYATRRETFAGGDAAATGPVDLQPRPSSGGGGPEF